MAGYRGIAEKVVEVYDFDWQNNTKMKEACICSVEGVIANVFNISLVLLAAAVLKILQEAIIFILVFAALRFYAGGAHAKNYIRCILSYLCVLLASVSCAKYGASIQGGWTAAVCGFSMLLAAAVNYRYAARQQCLGERTIVYRKKFCRIFMNICIFMTAVCILYPHTVNDSVREAMQKVILLQAFALLVQSTALWLGRNECRERR